MFRLREARLAYRTQRVEATGLFGRRLSTPGQVVALLAAIQSPDGNRLADEGVEHFGVLLLDTKHQVTAVHFCAKGTLDATVVHPRDVFRAAILGGAAAVVVFHNHPSGDVTPSGEDAALTARLKATGELVGIPLLDHVIIAGERHFSFRQGEDR